MSKSRKVSLKNKKMNRSVSRRKTPSTTLHSQMNSQMNLPEHLYAVKDAHRRIAALSASKARSLAMGRS